MANHNFAPAVAPVEILYRGVESMGFATPCR